MLDEMVQHILHQYEAAEGLNVVDCATSIHGCTGQGVKFSSFDGLWKYVFMGLLVATIKLKGSSVMIDDGLLENLMCGDVNEPCRRRD